MPRRSVYDKPVFYSAGRGGMTPEFYNSQGLAMMGGNRGGASGGMGYDDEPQGAWEINKARRERQQNKWDFNELRQHEEERMREEMLMQAALKEREIDLKSRYDMMGQAQIGAQERYKQDDYWDRYGTENRALNEQKLTQSQQQAMAEINQRKDEQFDMALNDLISKRGNLDVDCQSILKKL